MYEDILFPVAEGTEGSQVLHHAAALATWAGGRIRLLSVADTARDSVTVVESDVVDALEQAGRDAVAEAGETLDTLGVDYATDVVQGDPAATIAEYAQSYDYDLVVMPTHARRGLARHVLGSVTEKVVRLSSVPVMTARLADDEVTFPYERLLLPTDGSEAALRAARHGLELAGALDASVHVLSVVDDTALGPDVRSVLSREERERGARTAVERVADEADEAGVTAVFEHVEHGDPAAVIRECVDDYDAHAVVVGTTGRSGVDRLLLGSVAAKTVRTVPVPVVTVSNPE